MEQRSKAGFLQPAVSCGWLYLKACTEIADDASDGVYNVRFEGPAGSGAEAYASQHGISFTAR